MPEYEPIRDDSTVLTREMIDRLMRAYTGTGGMMYHGIQNITTAESEYQLDYDPCTYTTTTAYPAADINKEWCDIPLEWFDLPASDGTDESWNEPGPEPCTETELTDFLGI